MKEVHDLLRIAPLTLETILKEGLGTIAFKLAPIALKYQVLPDQVLAQDLVLCLHGFCLFGLFVTGFELLFLCQPLLYDRYVERG